MLLALASESSVKSSVLKVGVCAQKQIHVNTEKDKTKKGTNAIALKCAW